MKWVAVLCAIHCLALPLLAALLGVADVGAFHRGPWRWLEISLIAVALVVSGLQIFRSFLGKKFFLGCAGSTAAIAAVIAYEADWHSAFAVAMLGVAAFQLVAARQLKKKCSCPHPH